MLRDIGSSKAGSSRGRSKERTIKSKPRPKFPVRKLGAHPKASTTSFVIEIA